MARALGVVIRANKMLTIDQKLELLDQIGHEMADQYSKETN